MTFEPANFLHSLARVIATAASLEYLNTPRSLWRTQAVEADAASTYSGLAIFGGTSPTWYPIERLAMQVMTVARSNDNDAALTQASAIYRALHESDGRPLSMSTINAFKASDNSADGTWLIHGVWLNAPPAMLGADEAGRARVSFNFEISAAKAS